MPRMMMSKTGRNPDRFAKLRRGRAGDKKDFRVAAAGNGTVDVYVYDVIGWPWIEAQDFLYQIPRGAKAIHVHINSPGGDCFEGMAIYNLLTNHQAQVTAHVEGLAASAGSLVAMAGDTIKMSKASFLMIHNAWSAMSGDADDLRKEADLLDRISDVYAAAYCEKSGKDKAEVLELMRSETWFKPEEAVEAGLAHEIENGGQDADAINSRYDLSVFTNIPESLRQGAAASRQARAVTINQPDSKEETMDKKLRALLERLGLAKDATQEQAARFLAQLDLDTIQDPADKEFIQAGLDNMFPGGVIPLGASPEEHQAAVKAVAEKAVRDERQRSAEIRSCVAAAGLDPAFADTLIDAGKSLDDSRQAIFTEMKKTNPPIGSGAYAVGETDTEKFRAAVVDGLGARFGYRPGKPAPGSESFRSASITFIARQCLEREGVSARGLASRRQVADAVLQRMAQGGLSTSDFPAIFLDVANKSLLSAYQEAPATWEPFVKKVSGADFKAIYGVSLSEAPDLELITEHGEYKEGKFSDNQENYSIATYGKIVFLTRQMIINDDLRAFTRIPQLFGAAARRKESDLVYGKILGNPAMSDGKALFHEDHKNLETVAGNKGAVDSAKLSAGRAGMRKQKGFSGKARLDLRPAYLLIPVEQETDTDILLLSAALPTAEMSSGVKNPWAGKLTPVSEPRLDDVSLLAWYLIADPNQIDTIEVAYLDGIEEPYVEEQAVFERDGIGAKVRFDVGVGIMDWHGFWKNPGE